MTATQVIAEVRKGVASRFVRNIVVLMSGTAIAQVITVAMAPVLTRLYDPAAFGVFGVYMSVAGIAVAVATMRYDQALMLPRKTEDAANLLGMSVVCVVGITGLSAVVCIPFGGQIAAVTRSPELAHWLWLVPVTIFVAGTYQSFNAWCTRRKQFHRASISQVIRSVALSGTQAAAGLRDWGPLGLIGGSLAGETCASAALGIQVLRDDHSLLRRALRAADMRRLAREYSDFPLYGGPQSLLNAVSQYIPLLLLAHYFGPAVTGFYSLGVRILQLPMNLVLASLRQVFFQKATEVYNSGGDTYALFKKATLGLMALAIVPSLLIVLFATPVFSFVLGNEWYAAGEYARWLILWLAIGFANVPAVQFGQIYRKQRNLLAQDVGLLACRATALVVGGSYLNALQTVVLYSIVGIVFNAYIIAWMWRVLRRNAACVAAESP